MGTVLGLLIIGAIVWFIFFREREGGKSNARLSQNTASFAVIDLETSSLSPRNGRIIEIGVVHLDPQGNETHRWATLVNPGDRVAGRVDIHGIEAAWLTVAPTFEEVAGDLVDRLRGRVLVAHNAMFDCGFIDAEFERIGKPLGDYTPLCTMDVAGQLGLPRKLSGAADALGVVFNHHTAVEDAAAAGRIVSAGLRAGMTGHESGALNGTVLPTIPPSGRVVERGQAKRDTTPRPFLTAAMLNADVHDDGHDGNDHAYLDVLERSLEDGVLDPDERAQLVDLANALHLSHQRVLGLHHELVLAMLDVALEDGRITKEERAEIEQAATWLDVDLSQWDDMVKAAKLRARQQRDAFRAEVEGKVVAFTGRGVHPTDVREGLAIKHGMQFKSRVTKDTELLVVGADNVENQQTAAAAERGIPVMLEVALWKKLGVK
jgi:DNA polymerase-3 subunit epsilon